MAGREASKGDRSFRPDADHGKREVAAVALEGNLEDSDPAVEASRILNAGTWRRARRREQEACTTGQGSTQMAHW